MQKLLQLVMIVKNSAISIEKTLNAIKPYIDFWTIVDTGSTDNTKKIIKKCMIDIPGELYESKFVDFSTNRNEALDLAGCKCKYVIMLDDTEILHGGDLLRKFLQRTNNKLYYIQLKRLNVSLPSCRIIKTSFKSKYKYRVHEIIDSDKISSLYNDNIFILDEVNEYMNKRSNQRYKEDIINIKKDIEDFPTETRPVYFLAMTYFHLKDYKNALEYFNKRIEMRQGNSIEIYFSLYYIAYIHEITRDIIWEKIEKMYLRAYGLFPFRGEPLYRIVRYYYVSENIHIVDKYLKLLYKIKPPNDKYPYDIKLYTFQIPYLYIDWNMKCGNYNIAEKTLNNLLKIYPDSQRLLQLQYFLYPKEINVLTNNYNKIIVIHASNIENVPWCPKNPPFYPEIMASNFAETFIRIPNFKVILFGVAKKNNIDLEGMYNGVEYLDISKYNEFVKTHTIDHLIVSRDVENLVYYENIKNVYLWVHDMELNRDEIIQTHPKKFKKIICLSEYHKQEILKIYNFPEKLIYIFSGAISPDTFNHPEIQKQSLKFISLLRAEDIDCLEDILKVFEKIHEKYTSAELHIFSDEILDKNISGVYFRQIPENYVKEFLSGDFWINFSKTEKPFCYTTLEAQISRMICITNTFGSHKEICSGKYGLILEDDNYGKLIEQILFIIENKSIKNLLLEKSFNLALTKSYEFCFSSLYFALFEI